MYAIDMIKKNYEVDLDSLVKNKRKHRPRKIAK